jgi:hypothetical protein
MQVAELPFKFHQDDEKSSGGREAHEQSVTSPLFFGPLATLTQVNPYRLFSRFLLDTESTPFFAYAQTIKDAFC